MDKELPSLQVPEAQSHTAEETTPRPEAIPITRPESGDSSAIAGPSSQGSSANQRQPLLKAVSESQQATLPRSQENLNPFETAPVPPARGRDGHGRRASTRYQPLTSTVGPSIHPRSSSGIDWIVPVEEKSSRRRTVGERLQPTIDNAEIEREKFVLKAAWTGYALNIAIGLQVFLGALTTGLAAALQDARQAQISTAILGGLTTIVASYLARARGSGEPELSTRRIKDLEYFLRDCRAFQIDHAHEYATPGDYLDHRMHNLRKKLEELLGNVADDKKGPPTGIVSSQVPVQIHPAVP